MFIQLDVPTHSKRQTMTDQKSMLDSDGDGSVTDDLAKLGGGLLGGLFGGK